MKKISNLCKLIIFISLTIFLINKVGEIFIPEQIYDDKGFQGQTVTIKGYYELPKNTLDVLFLGDSSLMKGVSPMELWNDYGIASYVFGINWGRMYSFYYNLKDALRYQNPKLVVIDPVTLYYDHEPAESHLRVSVDYMKTSKVKLEMINDEIYNNTFEDKISIIFPLLRYHTRWTEMTKEELKKLNKKYHSSTKGFIMVGNVKSNKLGNSYMMNEKNIKMPERYKEYLIKIIKLCKEKNIKLMIAAVQDVRVWGKTESILLKKLCDEYGVDFYDMNNIDYGLNWKEDTSDGGGHMNVLGGMKVTKSVGTHIHNNYDLPDRRNDDAYKSWYQDYEIYRKERDILINIAQEKIAKKKLRRIVN